MFSAIVRERLIDSLEGTPDLLEYVLAPVGAGDARWDYVPETGLYSLRELLAHLADWDDIWMHRLRLTVDSSREPNLVSVNLADRAAERKYSESDPDESLTRLCASRPEMVAFLRGLNGQQWKRYAFHPEEGLQTIETQAAWILAHDDFYVKQAVRWLKRYRHSPDESEPSEQAAAG